MVAGINPAQKFAQSVGLVRDYLAKTGNTNLLGAMNNQQLRVFSENMSENVLGANIGNKISLNSKVLATQSPEKVASIFLHELTHFAKQSGRNSIAEEVQCRSIEENFLDTFGKGMYGNDEQLQATVRRQYAGLPEQA